MITFHFIHAWIILPLPFIWWYFILSRKNEKNEQYIPAVFISKYRGSAGLNQDADRSINWWWFCPVWFFLIVALAQPRYVGPVQMIKQPARNLMLVMDISGSMGTTDMGYRSLDGYVPKKRIDVSKDVITSFIDKRKGDRLGLVVFGLNAYLYTPLTLDLEVVKNFVNDVEIGLADDDREAGTAIGDAIALASYHLQNETSGQAVIILLTDGVDTSSELHPSTVAEIASQIGIKIYTVALGFDEIQANSLTQNNSNQLDSELLKQIAFVTNGRFYRAESFNDLINVYNDLNKLEPIETDSYFARPHKDYYHYFLMIALFIILLRLYLLIFKYRSYKNT